MIDAEEQAALHPAGEENREPMAYPEPHRMETPGGPMYVRWEEDPGISGHGLLTYFIEFLHVSGLWEEFVAQFQLVEHLHPDRQRRQARRGDHHQAVVDARHRAAHQARTAELPEHIEPARESITSRHLTQSDQLLDSILSR